MHIIIIGAGPGISQGVARKFGKEGFTVALVARKEDKLKKQVAELEDEGIRAIYAVADVSDEDSLKKALGELTGRLGHAEMILYNAAASQMKDILDMDWGSLKKDLDTSVGGCFNLLKAVLPWCLKENKGKLFITGGGLALSGNPQLTSLSVGKAALRNLVQAFQKGVAGTNVHIAQVTVCGFVNPEDPKYNPNAIAEQYWTLYQQGPGERQEEVIY